MQVKDISQKPSKSKTILAFAALAFTTGALIRETNRADNLASSTRDEIRAASDFVKEHTAASNERIRQAYKEASADLKATSDRAMEDFDKFLREENLKLDRSRVEFYESTKKLEEVIRQLNGGN